MWHLTSQSLNLSNCKAGQKDSNFSTWHYCELVTLSASTRMCQTQCQTANKHCNKQATKCSVIFHMDKIHFSFIKLFILGCHVYSSCTILVTPMWFFCFMYVRSPLNYFMVIPFYGSVQKLSDFYQENLILFLSTLHKCIVSCLAIF